MLIKEEVSSKREAMNKLFREQQKERMFEVEAIRKSIIELFGDYIPGTGLTNTEVLEWLISKGFQINARQISPKMHMMPNIFYQKNGKWYRRLCTVCNKPLKLGEKWIEAENEHQKIEGHQACVMFVTGICSEYENQVNSLIQQKNQIEAELDELKKRFVVPSKPLSNFRKIEL